MPFTHYPKLDANVIFQWRLPAPPVKPGFLGRQQTVNLASEMYFLKPGDTLVGYHSAQNFTRFYGSIAADQPLEVTFSFSNDEYDEDGNYVTDENIGKLHYDAEALKLFYDPKKQSQTGKFFVTIFGRWLKVEVKNPSERPMTQEEFVKVIKDPRPIELPDLESGTCKLLRLIVRASVF